MAKNAPLSLIQAKTAINQGMQTDIATGLQIESLAYSRITLYGRSFRRIKSISRKNVHQYIEANKRGMGEMTRYFS